MGLLKHFVLPIHCLVHINVVFLVIIKRDYLGTIEMFDWPAKEGGNWDLTMWEKHCFGIIGGAHLTFLAGELFAILKGDSQMRALMAFMEAINWGYAGYDAYRLGYPGVVGYVMSALSLIGLVVHTMEPGLLTKDHDKTVKKSK
jgi:hypothetical protein